MAISYSLEVAAPLSVTQVADELNDAAHTVGLFDASVVAGQLVDGGVVTVHGTWTHVFEKRPRPVPWPCPVAADLAFTPTMTVTFRFDKFRSLSDQGDDMARLVSSLLERVPGDAVLHFQYEDIWLLRRGDDLSLNERDDLWPQHRLAVISQPYRRATHRFSDK
jgi:hypothetical protein